MPEAHVASVHDLADGEMMTATVGDTEVLVSRVDGRFYACGARCTHYGAPLADGTLHGRLVVCPWHQAEFDGTTGALALAVISLAPALAVALLTPETNSNKPTEAIAVRLLLDDATDYLGLETPPHAVANLDLDATPRAADYLGDAQTVDSPLV